MLQTSLAHVQHFETGMHSAAGALRQMQGLITTLLGVIQRLQGRRGGAEQHRHPAALGAQQRQIAGVITEAVLLFVGQVVLLVDDDQTRCGQRVNKAERVPITTGAKPAPATMPASARLPTDGNAAPRGAH